MIDDTPAQGDLLAGPLPASTARIIRFAADIAGPLLSGWTTSTASSARSGSRAVKRRHWPSSGATATLRC